MSDISRLTGLPDMPRWVYKIFLRFPFLLPVRIKWKAASKGVGLLVSNLEGNKINAGSTLQDLGRKQGQAIANSLGFGKNVKEVMQVTVLANRVFGTKSKIISSNKETGKTKVSKCAWAGKNWGQRPCALLSAYEMGLVEGLNKEVKTKFLKKISKGDNYCLTEYRMN